MSRYITQFFISDVLTDYMKASAIKRYCGDLLYEALKKNVGKNHYAVRMDITFEEREHTRAYSVTIDVIDAPLIEATYGEDNQDDQA